MEKLRKFFSFADKNADRIGYLDGFFKLIRGGTIFGFAFGLPNFGWFSGLGAPEKIIIGFLAALIAFPITSLIWHIYKSIEHKWKRSKSPDYEVRFDTYYADINKYPEQTVEVVAKITFVGSFSEFHCSMKAATLNRGNNSWSWMWTTTDEMIKIRSVKSGGEISFPILISQKGAGGPLWGKDLNRKIDYLQHTFDLTLVAIRLNVQTEKSLVQHNFSVMLGKETVTGENNRQQVLMNGRRAHCDRQWIERQSGWDD